MTDQRQLLRHTLATLAYRGGKALRGAPAEFASFRAAPDSRSAGEILAHVCDLFDWASLICAGRQVWADGPVVPWEEGCARFFAGLEAFERALETEEPLAAPEEKLFQGPIADAFTHIGQISLLRRLAGSPVRGENYFKAEIVTGRVGPDQAAPRRELD